MSFIGVISAPTSGDPIFNSTYNWFLGPPCRHPVMYKILGGDPQNCTGMSMEVRINGEFHPYISRLDTSRK